MSEHLPSPIQPAFQEGPVLSRPRPGLAGHGGAPASEEGDGGLNLGRILAAVLRFKWLLVVCFGLGSVGAYVAYNLAEPEYRAEGSIWVNLESSNSGDVAPIAQSGLLQETGWIDLLRSYAVLDPVVIQQQLFINVPESYRPLFDGFGLADRFAPGQYTLEISEDGTAWTLTTEDGVEVGTGAVGDSVGVALGFRWLPPALRARAGESIRFGVINPRDAARQLSEQLQAQMDRRGNFLRLNYTGKDPERVAAVLQAVMEEHVRVAAELKGGKLAELTVILGEQLASVQGELEAAERELESFRVQTITLPAEESSPISAGLEQTRGPVFSDYFTRRLELETLSRDQDRLAAVLDSIPLSGVRVESFELIPAVSSSSQLRSTLTELTQRRAELRTLLQDFTGEYPPVQVLQRAIQELESLTLPQLTRSLMAELAARERELRSVLGQRSGELQEIPPRAIEEARLERRVAIADRLYIDLRERFETARLADASSIADIEILDHTRVPSVPSSDQRLPFAAAVFVGFLGLGLLGALVMDRLDPRFRYLSEVNSDMGLEILGVVPRLRSGRRENSHAVFESFRDIRMRTEFAHGTARPIVVAITSPDTNEGKTFVSANLAIAFAQLGQMTLLIDGDTRRGDLHELFDLDRKPGLTDLLEGRLRDSAIRPTAYDNLDILPSGSRRTASPELLSSGRMQQALAALKPRYDVIIVDCPPMAAGSDAFVLGAHAGNLILVMRSGSTNKELAKGKMETFLRLPVRILGGVLNDIDESDASVGYHRYYSYYLPDYVPSHDEPLEEGAAGRAAFSPPVVSTE